jgi:hypothetical protein
MSLRQQLSQELQRQQGLCVPTASRSTVRDAGLTLEIDFLAVDSIGCSLEQLALTVPALNGAAFDALKTWAQSLSRRITYLLEQIGPLEFDETAGEVLIRSTPPTQLPDGTQYYEILLQSQQGGRFALQRYQAVKGQPGRSPIPMTMTHEVLLKLTDDLVATIPGSTP